MKTHKVVYKIAFQVFNKIYFSQISAELQQKLTFCPTILKVYFTKRKNTSGNFKPYQFSDFRNLKNQKFGHWPVKM